MPIVPLLVAADHPAFAGHFPGRPIVPGVVLVDLAKQAIELTSGLSLAGLTVCKFLSPAAPGDALELEFEAGQSSVSYEIRSRERKVASGGFLVRAAQ